MSSHGFAFGRFVLDPHNRRLSRDGEPLALNRRYLDALLLLISEQGRLVTKERLLDEVWKRRPVTDEAITQCIKTLRKRLDDDASNPRYIETVHRHGYRFVAPVVRIAPPHPSGSTRDRRRLMVELGTASTFGGGFAGVVGGLLYGFVAASQAAEAGTGVLSVLLVVTCLTILIAALGGAGVGFGIAAARLLFRHSWLTSVAGGAIGGLFMGAAVKLLGIDAISLLFGKSPGDITGATEGVLLGGAVGLGAWLAGRATHLSIGRTMSASAVIGATAGTLIALIDGRLMVGSLDLLTRQFAGFAP